MWISLQILTFWANTKIILIFRDYLKKNTMRKTKNSLTYKNNLTIKSFKNIKNMINHQNTLIKLIIVNLAIL